MFTQNQKHNIVIALVLVALLAGVGFWIVSKTPKSQPLPPEAPQQNTGNNSDEISIKSIEIKENNFTGTRPEITGESELAVTAKKYANDIFVEFKTQADKDVPDMREKFGAESPVASYTLDIDAKYLDGPKAESIVLNTYAYTGGANGNSYYKVATASKKTGKILALADVVREGQETAFTNLVKNKLFEWQAPGEGMVVFEDVVNDLKFHNFSNWSMDDKNLTLYFAKYEVGPGVLGPLALPLPLGEMDGMLETSY